VRRVLRRHHSLAGQSNVERITNDHYTRSHDYDLIHQRIEVSRFDWDSTSFDGNVATTLVSRRAGLDSVILDAGAKLVIGRVTARVGHAAHRAPWRHPRRFPGPVGFGDTTRSQSPTTAWWRAATASRSSVRRPAAPPAPDLEPGEDHDNHYCSPLRLPNDKMTWELVATCPGNDGRLQWPPRL